MKRRLSYTAAILALILAALYSLSLWRPRTLLERATRVPVAPAEDGFDAWQTDRALLVFQPISHESDHWQIARIEASTGLKSALLPYSRDFAAQTRSGFHSASVSPDGRWMLLSLSTRQPGGDPDTLFVSEIDGPRRYRWPTSGTINQIQWFPDSRRWIAWKQVAPGRQSGALYSLEKPGEPGESIPAPGLPILGLTRDGQAVTTNFMHIGSMWNSPVDLYLWDILDGKVFRKTTVPMPPDHSLNDLLLSPQGDRLLWITTRTHYPPGGNWMRRFLSYATAYFYPRATMIVSVSSNDGSGRREIAHDERTGQSTPIGFHWLPDGKRIGFHTGEDLWTVPVDP